MSSYKLAIAHCVHHKPWLITSTILSTYSQTITDFHTFFLINEGHQRDLAAGRYAEEFSEFLVLRDKYTKDGNSSDFRTSIKGSNTQLDHFDSDVRDFCKINDGDSSMISYENDHALDSGAWIKFIRSGKWKSYDAVLFLGEGSLLTRRNALENLISATRGNNINFITGSQDKRFLSRKRWTDGYASEAVKGEMPEFHNRMIEATYSVFLRDPKFKEIFEKWPYDSPTIIDNIVPKVWGPNSRLLRYINSPFFHVLKYIYPRKEDSTLRFLRNQELVDSEIESKKQGSLKLYKENEVGWYGACCNHFITKEALEKISIKFEEYDIYDVLDLPYAATALEQIWGLIPYWIGEELWFSDAIHRVRKNFFTYEREDYPKTFKNYLQRYYSTTMKVNVNGARVELSKILNNSGKLEKLSPIYRNERIKK